MERDAPSRKPYPTDMCDDWAFAALNRTSMREDAPRRRSDVREVCNAWRWDDARFARTAALGAGSPAQPTAVMFDSATRQSRQESRARADCDGSKRTKGSKIHVAIDTLGHLLALKVTPANEQDREKVAALAEAVPEATEQTVEVVVWTAMSPGLRDALLASWIPQSHPAGL